MGIENYPEIKNGSDLEKNSATKRNFFKQFAGLALAAGILTLGTSDSALAKKRSEPQGAETFISQVLTNTPDRQKEYRQKNDFLENFFSKKIFEYLAIAETQSREAKGKIKARPQLKGFEQLGIDPKFMLKVFSEEDGCFPAGMIDGNIAELRYINKAHESFSQYGMAGRFASSAIESRHKDNILFYRSPYDPRSPEKGDPGDAFQVRIITAFASHEAGHMAAGDFSNSMTPEQRVDFFYEVAHMYHDSNIRETIASKDYVDQIKAQDEKSQNYLVVSEYWAILCESYLNRPEEFFALASKQEKELVQKWLLKEKGQNFDPKAARDRRYYLTEQMVADQIAKAKQRMGEKTRLAAPKKHLQGKKPAFPRRR